MLMFVALGGYLDVGSRGDFRLRMLGIGACGLLATLLFALDNVLFVVSLMRTDVANTLLMISSAPAFAAVFSTVFLRERVSRKTMVMIAVAILAILIILTGDLGRSALVGNLAGLGTAICIAGPSSFSGVGGHGTCCGVWLGVLCWKRSGLPSSPSR